MARETLPPTLLFAGPSGVGKFRTARALAAALNCLEPVGRADDPPIDACGKCRSCERIARGVHVDVLELAPDERASIKIDVVREVHSRIGYRPFEGRRRVVIIRDADTLETAAQNALLKSLEEPPPATVFILTTSVPGALLPTVRSRCMRLAFGRLSAREVAAALMEQDRSEREALEIAAVADGSVAQALALGSTDLAALRETALLLLEQAARNPAAATRLQAAALLAVPQPKKDRSRAEVALILRVMASMLRDLELLNSEADRRALANPTLSDELQRMAAAYGGDRARVAFAAVDKALVALDRNAGIKVVSDWLAMQI